MEVHQLIANFAPGDAMGQAAVNLQALLRRLGHFGELYAGEVAPGFGSLVKPAAQLHPTRDALVLYHHGIASEWAGRLLHFDCRRGVVFHNVTPARFYAGTRLEEALRSGRSQLTALAEGMSLSIGVSALNAIELREAGHRNVQLVPLFVEPHRFDPEQIDLVMKRELKVGAPLVLSVSRVVPHKRVEDLLSLHAELLRIRPTARLVVIGGYAAGQRAFRQLAARAEELGRVDFLGKVSHGELVAAYRGADVYVSMSEHEGFGVPLVEAMAADLPVLAFGAASVPWTMGGTGIVFDTKHFAALAELVVAVTEDDGIRRDLIEGQQRRLAELSAGASEAALAQALATLPPSKEVRRAPRAKQQVRKTPRVAIVVQRFGPQITGGAEAHARQLALKLSPHADLTILTTCAEDHLTWANTLPEGIEDDGPLTVHRFATEAPRQMRGFNRLSDAVLGHGNDRVTEEHWLAEQGPRVPDLLAYLASNRAQYDAFIFFTYLYTPTAWGVPLVADKALVVPTAHDEPPFRFDVFSDVFERPRALLCNSPEEQQLIQQRHPQAVRTRIVGVGVEPPRTLDPKGFAQKHGIRGPYLLYVGRQEAGKGLKELLKHHRALVNDFHDAPTLVLAGGGTLELEGERVRTLGRISEEDKWNGLAGALAAVAPSRFESLSLLALEAFAVGTPLLANADSSVLAGHVERSGAGATWHSTSSYLEAVRIVGEGSFREQALKYSRAFRWPKVVAAFRAEIARIQRDHAS
ncbi:MAG: Hexosyltransferase [Myxococcaceae bacterium]|nr:Hexosyltransferase [Myxococcaceae bacterium]